jgi:hypothetical protein
MFITSKDHLRQELQRPSGSTAPWNKWHLIASRLWVLKFEHWNRWSSGLSVPPTSWWVTQTHNYDEFSLSLLKKRLLVRLSSSLGDFAALTRNYKAWMDRIIGRAPTSVLLRKFLMQPNWQLSVERCKRSGNHP